MKTVYYKDFFIPPEWIAAHGLRPERARPPATGGVRLLGAAEGVCPYAAAFIQEAGRNSAEGVIVTTRCDQMRRGREYIARFGKPTFLFNLPATWQTPEAGALYLSELKRLSGFLLELGGRAPSPAKLAEVMLAYDEERKQLRAERALLASRAGPGPALALVGGPRLREGDEIFNLVAKAGGWVALDATGSGELGSPPPFIPTRLQQDPLAELARNYFARPHIFRRPNTLFYDWLKPLLAESNITGIILLRYLWCDLWHGEVQSLTAATNLPLLDLVLEQETPNSARLGGRIQAFLEMLS